MTKNKIWLMYYSEQIIAHVNDSVLNLIICE